MKIKKSNSDEKFGKMSLSGSSVFNRLGSSWSENKMDRSSSRVSKRESPRKVRLLVGGVETGNNSNICFHITESEER